ncbi:transposase, partial [Glycomyces tenuis]
TVADVPVDAREVTLTVRVRRLRCENRACPRRTCREQIHEVLERYQRRTGRLALQVGAVVRELAGRASQRTLRALSMAVSRHTAIRMLLRLPLPPQRTPAVLGVDDFAVLLRPEPGNAERLEAWITAVRAEDLPHLHSFIRGLDQDRAAVIAGLTLPFHNGRTEGVNTKTKLTKRQMYGRAGFELLRHRALLGSSH